MNLKQKYRIIGGVAYITKRKGYAQLIDALKKLPRYALILVGDGPHLSELQQQARQNGVDGRCLWLGNRKEGGRYMKYFDVYALCSHTEGYPLAFIELPLPNCRLYVRIYQCSRASFRKSVPAFSG